jgi:hypothetical protein
VRHLKFSLFAIGILDNTDGLSDVVLTFRHHLNNSSVDSRRNHNLMLGEKIVLKGRSDNISTDDHITSFEVRGIESPEAVLI